MTEQTLDPTPAPPIEGGPAPATSNSSTDDKRYGAYDDTYLKYVPGVYKNRKDAAAAAKAAGVKKFTIREV